MKHLKSTILIFIVLLILSRGVEAKKVKLPNKKAQTAFTQEYFDAKGAGGQAWHDYRNEMMNQATDAEYQMFKNLEDGKTAGGSEKSKKQLAQEQQQVNEKRKSQGFMGDPNDPGPQDWSDWNIKTDGKGNVIGFEEKDFDEKDKNGDGKIDKKERKEWDEKKKKEHEEAGGAPGEVPPIADWDKNGDGKPDKGWDRWCWQCCEGEGKRNECHYGRPGNCDNGGSCEISEVCMPADEVHDGETYECHECEYMTDAVDWCGERGYFSDSKCGAGCPAGPCIPIDVDLKTGRVMRTNETRERGSTRQCFTCMRVTSIEIEYYVYVIETPFAVYVLDDNERSALSALADFDVSSIMGLARSDSSSMDKVKGLMGSMGLDPMALLGGSFNLESLSSLLQQGMADEKNKYGDDCFDDFTQPNFAKQAPTSSSETDKKTAAKNKKKKIEDGPRVDGEPEFGVDPKQAMSADGPIIACGKSGKEKALMIMDSSGNPIEKILQSTLEKNPHAIMQALQRAQGVSQTIQEFRQGGVSGLITKIRQKAIGAAKKKLKEFIFGKKGDPATTFEPNDQLFKHLSRKQQKLWKKYQAGKSSDLGKILSWAPYQKGMEFKDQWGIQRIGYTPTIDKNSAWNVVDGKEKNVIVAVVDSGIDFEHPDGPQYIWTNPGEIADNGIDDDGNGFIDDVHGWNFIEHNNDLTDKRGHGTHVAGIIAAKRNNNIGIAGINPGAIIMPIKVADKEGETDSVKVFQGINYAVNHGAQIINVSLGGKGRSQLLQEALDHAHDMGVFVAVASGNTGEYLGNMSPASTNHAFTVSALDYNGKWSTISSVGPNNALLAPGEQILSLRSKDSFHKRAIKDPIDKLYFRQSGTSFSTPMAAATASLMLAKNPNLTPTEIEDILLNTATDMDVPGWDGQYGAGLLNAAEALRAIDKSNFLTVKIDRFQINRDEDEKLQHVDVYATVRGDFESFTVNLGRGKRAKKFKLMAGPFMQEAHHAWVARIQKENLRSSNSIVKIEVTDQNGDIKSAQALLELK